MKKGQIYKGFKVLDVRKLDEISSSGIYLLHEKSGLKVFHLLNKDEENMFAFSFKTPPENSKGIAHIVEHTTLCGSKNFPLKDPFISMRKSLMSTFLNAMTSKDHTIYPAASFIPQDYFNLMKTYGDAVFFPLLREESFLQEGKRIEIDKDGNYSFQGVVFNEMSSDYSSSVSIIRKEIFKSIYKGCPYEFDSGGDPLEIATLTYQEYLDFYKKHYSTRNCFLYLYGNIDTKKQLDFIEENFLSKISDCGKEISFSWTEKQINPLPYKRISLPALKENGDPEKDASLYLTWLIDCDKKDYLELRSELFLLSAIFFLRDTSPLKKFFHDTLGCELDCQQGLVASLYNPSFTIGLTDLNSRQAKKIEKEVFKILTSFSKETFDSQFVCDVTKEVRNLIKSSKASDCQPGLTYMYSSIRGSYYAEDPYMEFYMDDVREKLYKKAEEDPHFLPGLIKKYFLDNKKFSVILCKPSSEYPEQREKLLQKTLLKEKKIYTKKELLEKMQAMSALQNKDESEEADKLLPKTDLKNLRRKSIKMNVKHEKISGLPFIYNEIPENPFIYFSIVFPIDLLPVEDYKIASLLTPLLSEIGWKGKNWEEGERLIHRYSQGFFLGLETSAGPEKDRKTFPYKNIFNRDIFKLDFKCNKEDFKIILGILKDCLLNTDFSDYKRIKHLLKRAADYTKLALFDEPLEIASTRNRAYMSKSGLIDELKEGYTAFVNLSKSLKVSIKKLSADFLRVYKKIISSGSYFTCVADAGSLKEVKSCLPEFISDLNLVPFKEALNQPYEDFYKLIEVEGKKSKVKSASVEKDFFNVKETLIIPGSVAYSSIRIPWPHTRDKEYNFAQIFALCMERGPLWKKIRMEGGAYGLFLGASIFSGFGFVTYRDPNPFDSLEIYKECLKEYSEKLLTQDEIFHALIYIWSCVFKKIPPMEKGKADISYFIEGITNSYFKKRDKWRLQTKPEDLRKVCRKILEKFDESSAVIVCSKGQINEKIKENTGKIINLRL